MSNFEKLASINVNGMPLLYSPKTGQFFWSKKKGCRAANSRAGTKRHDGYWTIFVAGSRYLAHRIAFLAMTGEMPIGVVDHINGNTSDNRWINLRDVDQSTNNANRRGLAQSNSKTGLIGASPHAGGKYIAQIRRNKKHIYLGLYATPELAHVAYMEASNVR